MVGLLFKCVILLVASGSGVTYYLPDMALEHGRKINHPFFVSVTELNHNQTDNIIEISCKMFADDFENALKTRYKTTIDITNPKDPKQVNRFIYDYIQKHIQLRVNDKLVMLEYVGYEKESEAVWCYLQVKDINRVRKLDITSNLLYEMYNTQIGIIHASVGGQRKSTRLDFPETNASFQW